MVGAGQPRMLARCRVDGRETDQEAGLVSESGADNQGLRWRMTSLRNVSSALAGMLVVLIAGSALAAVSVTNRDDKDHKLTVIEDEGAKKTDHMLKPNQVLEGVCAQGCVIRMNDSDEDEYELEGTEVVSIEEGYLYYDGPEGEQTNTGSDKPAGAPPGQAPPAKK